MYMDQGSRKLCAIARSVRYGWRRWGISESQWLFLTVPKLKSKTFWEVHRKCSDTVHFFNVSFSNKNWPICWEIFFLQHYTCSWLLVWFQVDYCSIFCIKASTGIKGIEDVETVWDKSASGPRGIQIQYGYTCLKKRITVTER